MTPTDRLAELLLERLGIPLAPPVPVERLAQQLGVERIQRRDMFEEGRLERRGGDIRIYIREDLSRERARFTVAHEIAHLVMAAPDASFVAYRDRLRTGDEERLCDQIAAGILLPAPWVRERFAHRVQNLSTVRHLSHLGEVSMAAAVVRLTELCNWTASLLRWRNVEGRWIFLAGAAVPRRLHGSIGSAQATGMVLDGLRRRTRRDIRAPLPILVRGRPVDLEAQLSVSGDTALALARFDCVR